MNGKQRGRGGKDGGGGKLEREGERLWLGDGAEQVGKLKLFLRLKRKGGREGGRNIPTPRGGLLPGG